MNLILFGPPGSGKGTQSRLVQNAYHYKQISTGDLVREEIAKKTPLGLLIKKTVDEGSFPSDEAILELFGRAYDASSEGYIFDGFPRTERQAEMLLHLLKTKNAKLDAVVEIQIAPDILKQRILGRFSCQECGEIYNKQTHMPKVDGVCDVCGSTDFLTRSDDTEEALQTRLDLYHSMTQPVLGYLRNVVPIYTVDGKKDSEQVFAEIKKIIAAQGEGRTDKVRA